MLPRAVKLVDIPILLGLLVLYWIAPRTDRPSPMSARYLLMAVAVPGRSASRPFLVNSGRIEPGPTLLFIYGFLAPDSRSSTSSGPCGRRDRLWRSRRLLVALAWIQLAGRRSSSTCPNTSTDKNPDVVSGTFGENAYQLVFFLLMCTALVAGIATVERKRLVGAPRPALLRRRRPPRSCWRSTGRSSLTAVLTVALRHGAARPRPGARCPGGRARGGRRSSPALSVIPSDLPRAQDSRDAINTITGEPGVVHRRSVSTRGRHPNLYTDQPAAIVVGAGPGTVNSRAWETLLPRPQPRRPRAAASRSSSERAQTDVASKYTIPRLRSESGAIDGSFDHREPVRELLRAARRGRAGRVRS